MRPQFRNLAVLGAVALAYFCMGKLGLSLAFLDASASPVWPPTGFALAAVLLAGYRVWPAILLGAFALNAANTGTILAPACMATGNTLEALIGAYLAHRFAGGAAAFDRARDIFRYVFLAAVPSTAISATIGVCALALFNQASSADYRAIWFTWWTGDLISAVVVAPLLLIWAARGLPRLSRRRWIELLALLVSLLVVGGVVFGELHVFELRYSPMEFLALPILLWAAFRFHQRGASMAAALMSAVAIWGTLSGRGPFAGRDANTSLLLLQMFIGIVTLTSLVLAALVAERAHIDESLRQSEQRLRIAMEAGRMGTWEWDIDNGAVNWSPALEQIHGLAPGAFAGTFEAFLACVHPDDRETVKQRVARTLAERIDHHVEYRIVRPDGQLRWVEGRGRLACDASGKPLRMIGLCTDVTDRVEANERERAARSDAERANRAKDQFLAILSHELRTPLTPVLLTASALERDASLPGQVRKDASLIRRNVELEARLIDDLLDLTRITRGKLQMNFELADLHELIRHAATICCDGSVRVQMQLDAREHHVRGDPARLQQIFWNLLNNAQKFTPSGGLITIRSSNPTDGTITVEVIDTGAGIEPDLLPRLFSAFEQGTAAASSRKGGLGLGLAISKALVAAHHGGISARSEGKGRGATFIVQVPTSSRTTGLVSVENQPMISEIRKY